MVATKNLDQNPLYADPEGPPPPPPPHPRHAIVARTRKIMAEASTQSNTPEDAPAWSTFDIGRAMTALRSGRPEIQRQLLRRLHVRWWHASTTKMQHILRQAGITGPVIDMCKSICETCIICSGWAPPGLRPMAKTRISTALNQVMQADLLFWKDRIILHMIDECIRFSMLAIVESKGAMDLCRSMTLWRF